MYLLRSITGISEETVDLGLHIMIFICGIFAALFILAIVSVVMCKRKSPQEQLKEDIEQIKYLNEMANKQQNKGKS